MKDYEVVINEVHLRPHKQGKIIFVPCNPRVGGTVISQALADIMRVKHYDGGPYSNSMDFNSLDRTVILHGHFMPEDIEKLKLQIPYQVITIKRNPLDTLASAYKFAQKSLFNTLWHNGEVFKDVSFSRPSSLKSIQFYDWATSKRSSYLFEYTKSWLNKADALISFEEYKSNPVKILRKALHSVNPNRSYSSKEIFSVVSNLEDNFLVNTHNRHRWKGESDYLLRMLPKDKYEAIRNYHKKDMEVLGYWE